jgi:hypothetical protein
MLRRTPLRFSSANTSPDPATTQHDTVVSDRYAISMTLMLITSIYAPLLHKQLARPCDNAAARFCGFVVGVGRRNEHAAALQDGVLYLN